MFHVATVLYFVVLNLALLALVASASFSYTNQNMWPSQCDGMRQSPININTNAALSNSVLIPLTFHDYNKPIAGTLTNIGSTVEFVPAPGASMAVSNHRGIYDLQKINIRWGTTNVGGSEHQLNDAQRTAEIQLIHHKQRGSTARDAYSIVAVFADVTMSDASTVWDKFDPPPTAYLGTKSISGSNSISGNNYQYDDLLPPLPATSPRPYYYYEGSFTTPLCTESVQWFILKDNITIPRSFLDKLRMLKINGSPNSPLLTFNFRNLQPLNARDVFKFS